MYILVRVYICVGVRMCVDIYGYVCVDVCTLHIIISFGNFFFVSIYVIFMYNFPQQGNTDP